MVNIRWAKYHWISPTNLNLIMNFDGFLTTPRDTKTDCILPCTRVFLLAYQIWPYMAQIFWIFSKDSIKNIDLLATFGEFRIHYFRIRYFEYIISNTLFRMYYIVGTIYELRLWVMEVLWKSVSYRNKCWLFRI